MPSIDCAPENLEQIVPHGELEAFHRTLAETIPHMLWMTRPNGSTYYLNHRCLDHLGITLDRATDWNWLELLHPADVERSRGVWEAAFETGSPYRNEYRVRQKDGSYRWYLAQAAPLTRTDGTIQGWLGTWTDVDDAKLNQESMRLAHEFQSAILDSLDSNIAVLDETGEIIAVNRSWQRFAAQNGFHDSHYGIGLNYLEACVQRTSASESSEAAAAIRRIIAGEINSFELEYPCHSPAEQRWFVMRVTPFNWTGPRRVVVAHHDITSRKVAELSLRQSENRFNRAIRGTSDGVWEWDLATGRVWLAPHTQSLLGITAGPSDDRHIDTLWPLVHPEDDSRLREMFDRQRTELKTYDTEVRLLHQDQRYLWFRMRACTFLDDSGQARWISGSLQNISAEIEAAQKVRHLASIVESTTDAIISNS